MPTAHEELRQEWKHYEADGGDQYAIRFLQNRGYRLHRTRYTWSHPDPEHVLTPQEASAMMYLVHEWDFGGLE
jgi:hypothetical protein